MKNSDLIVLFVVFLIISCQAYHRNLKSSLKPQNDKCFEFDLKKLNNTMQNSLNLINLLSYHRAANNKEKTFVSFHQKLQNNKIYMSESLVEDVEANKTNATTISVYMQNKYNTQVFYIYLYS